MIIEMTLSDLENVKNSPKAIVDFYAPWCGPCRMLGPVLEEISNEENIDVYKVNIDNEKELSDMFNVEAVPTVFIFEQGKVKNKMVGFQPKNGILKFL